MVWSNSLWVLHMWVSAKLLACENRGFWRRGEISTSSGASYCLDLWPCFWSRFHLKLMCLCLSGHVFPQSFWLHGHWQVTISRGCLSCAWQCSWPRFLRCGLGARGDLPGRLHRAVTFRRVAAFLPAQSDSYSTACSPHGTGPGSSCYYKDKIPIKTMNVPIPRSIYPATSINVKRSYWSSEEEEIKFINTLFSKLQDSCSRFDSCADAKERFWLEWNS